MRDFDNVPNNPVIKANEEFWSTSPNPVSFSIVRPGAFKTGYWKQSIEGIQPGKGGK